MATSLRNIETLVKNIRDLTQEMQEGADRILIPEIKKLWAETKGADGRKMKALVSDKYKAYKQKEVGNQLANLKLSGDLQDSLTTEGVGKNRVSILFGSVSQRDKAEGNANKRPGMMRLSKNKSLNRTYRRWLLKKMMGKI